MRAAATERALHLSEEWLRERVTALASIHRPTASPGEREAAEWVVSELSAAGVEARLEEEDSAGGYWWPLGLAAAAGVAAGATALAGRRWLGAALGAAAAAAAIDDLPPRGRRLRRLLPKRSAWNVVSELGPSDAERTVVLVAHHDAAHSGAVFHPLLPELADRLGFIERNDTSPPLMWPVVGCSAVVAGGAISGSRALTKLGIVLSAGVAASMAEIGARGAVPGANDNATGVVTLLAIARTLVERPPQSARVILVSTSEEATCEGMHHFAGRYFPQLSRERTFFLTVDTVGSPHLCVLRGEGMLGVKEYPPEALALIDGLAGELGIDLFPNLRLRNATDGVYPLDAGYPSAALCSCTTLKQPANYHWQTDVPENVDYGSVADAIRLAEALVRRLDERWLS